MNTEQINKKIELNPTDFKSGNGSEPRPLYSQVKDFIRGMIETRQWLPNTRIPSENEIVKTFSISRMTVNRALRELTMEGLLRRLHGVGTFVAQPRSVSPIMEIRDIAAEIASSGGNHRLEVLFLQEEKASVIIANAIDIPIGSAVYHSRILHKDGDSPVLLTERWVNPVVAPDFTQQDFTKESPSAYLCRVAPVAESEFFIEARMPSKENRRLLQLKDNEPCLLLSRTIISGSCIASLSWFTYPGLRYRFKGSFRPNKPG